MLRYLVAAIAALSSTAAAAQDWHILSLREFDLDAYRLDNHRDSYMQYADPGQDGEHWTKGIATDFKLDMVKYGEYGLYWDNRVEMFATNAQPREVGWRYEVGLQLGPRLQAYWLHHSRHVLDDARDDRFPLHNSVGAKYVFYRRDDQ